ncbi:hypothetical protein GCM10028775_34220 [Catellatospora paridis]
MPGIGGHHLEGFVFELFGREPNYSHHDRGSRLTSLLNAEAAPPAGLFGTPGRKPGKAQFRYYLLGELATVAHGPFVPRLQC